MKYIVAVSGGVDSVVLLDMLAKRSEHELVIAHFDHGIRPESDADARFVRALANTYGLTFEEKREELGAAASEELARNRRYEFLRTVANKHSGTIVTAHHKDDVVESIAINIVRGTGWRGLAVLASTDIERPLVTKTKAEIYEYALEHSLEWVEDETNYQDIYMRNRIRRRLAAIEQGTGDKLYSLRNSQIELAEKINTEVGSVFEQANISRYFFSNIDESVALELLRALLARSGKSLTRPQRKRMLHAIKVMQPGNIFEAGEGVELTFTKREFVVKTE